MPVCLSSAPTQIICPARHCMASSSDENFRRGRRRAADDSHAREYTSEATRRDSYDQQREEYDLQRDERQQPHQPIPRIPPHPHGDSLASLPPPTPSSSPPPAAVHPLSVPLTLPLPPPLPRDPQPHASALYPHGSPPLHHLHGREERTAGPVRAGYTRFSDVEQMMLFAGVRRFGPGKWKLILAAYPFNARRSPVDLKDKWRNVLKKQQRRTRNAKTKSPSSPHSSRNAMPTPGAAGSNVHLQQEQQVQHQQPLPQPQTHCDLYQDQQQHQLHSSPLPRLTLEFLQQDRAPSQDSNPREQT
jgi:hypothetical protein